MRLILVRHGETDWNVEGRCQGFSDVSLNATGRRQAECVGGALRQETIAAVYSSPLIRAVSTARRISDSHGLGIHLEPGLREMNQGCMEGLTHVQLQELHAEFLVEWGLHPAELRIPGGESLADVQKRAWAVVDRIAHNYRSETVAVVSHNLTILTILCKALNVALDDFRTLRQSVAGINVLEFDGDAWNAVRLNDTSHLAVSPEGLSRSTM